MVYDEPAIPFYSATKGDVTAAGSADDMTCKHGHDSLMPNYTTLPASFRWQPLIDLACGRHYLSNKNANDNRTDLGAATICLYTPNE